MARSRWHYGRLLFDQDIMQRWRIFMKEIFDAYSYCRCDRHDRSPVEAALSAGNEIVPVSLQNTSIPQRTPAKSPDVTHPSLALVHENRPVMILGRLFISENSDVPKSPDVHV